MALAVQSAIEVQIQPLAQVDFAALTKDGVRTLVLLRDVAAVPFAYAHGLTLDHLNLGNVHFGAGRRQVSPSVFLAEAELQALKGLSDKGVRGGGPRGALREGRGAGRADRALGKGRVTL